MPPAAPSKNPSPASADAPAPRGGLTRQRLLVGVLILGTLAVAWYCWLLAAPFAAALVWALSFAVVALPLHRWLERKTGKRPGLAAGLSVLLIALVIIAPIALVVNAAVSQGVKITASAQKQIKDNQWRKTIEDKPRLKGAVAWVEQQEIDLGGQLQGAAGAVGGWAGAALAGLGKAAIGLLLTLFVLFFFFRDHADFLRYTRGLLPLSERETDDLFQRIADTIHATIYGTVLVRLLQGALGGLMFWWLGLPAPLLWGAVMAVVSIIPVLGAFVIWVPAAIFLAASGHIGKAIILTIWGVGVIGTADNVLYPTLVGDRLKMHTLPVFVAMVGGLSVFGAAGIVLGPVVLAVGDQLVEVWRQRTANGKSAETALPPS